jgi:hypothetical protein
MIDDMKIVLLPRPFRAIPVAATKLTDMLQMSKTVPWTSPTA